MNRTSVSRALVLVAGLAAGLWGCADNRSDDIDSMYNPNGGGGGGGDDGNDGGSGDDGSDDGATGTGGDDGGDGTSGDGGDDGTTAGDGGTTSEEAPPESPYQGGWDIGTCQDSIQGNATQPGNIGVGSVLLDWTLPDQFGDQVRFYDFCHEVIYYVVVAGW